MEKITVIDTETGVAVERELTADELAQRKVDADNEAARLAALAIPLTAAEKLFNATGLTVAEYKALGL